MYGRGTQDDKGPLLASLYAVKALMDAGVKFNKRVRFIFGTDEETLWRCINRYTEKEEMPSFGFSPDARFPVTYAEKGLLQLHLEGSNESGIRLTGGSAFNAVPDMILYEGERQDDLADKLDQLGFEYEWNEDGIEVKGRAAHAMIPEEGINAIARLCIALKAIGIESKAINFIAQEIGEDPNATRIFGDCADAALRQAQVQRGQDRTRSERNNSPSIPAFPVTVSKEEIGSKAERCRREIWAGIQRVRLAGADLSSPWIISWSTTLMKVYREYQRRYGSPNPCLRAAPPMPVPFKNCVAFGALDL